MLKMDNVDCLGDWIMQKHSTIFNQSTKGVSYDCAIFLIEFIPEAIDDRGKAIWTDQVGNVVR